MHGREAKHRQSLEDATKQGAEHGSELLERNDAYRVGFFLPVIGPEWSHRGRRN